MVIIGKACRREIDALPEEIRGDLETLYGHLSKISVREGQRVSRGQELGAVGASGRATGAHLHYEVRQNDEPVNPRRYLVD